MTPDKDSILADVGERELVRFILKTLHTSPHVRGGSGNDATAVDLGGGQMIAVTVDRCPTPLACRVDPPDLAVWGDLAITCVTSDLLASGAVPLAFLMSLMLPRNMCVGDAIALVERADAAARRLGAGIIAGDTKESSQVNVVTFGVGRFVKGRQIGRRGARPGDILVVTGELGAFTGAQLGFHRGLTKSELDARLLQPIFAPMPADKTVLMLLESVNPTAGMDLSDGLLSTVFALAELNDLGITLREGDIPISRPAVEIARRFSVEPLRLAFGTGDWQIAYAVDPKEWRRLDPAGPIRTQVVKIGEFTDAHSEVLLTCVDERRRQLREIEQQHFLETSADRGFLEHLLDTPLFT